MEPYHRLPDRGPYHVYHLASGGRIEVSKHDILTCSVVDKQTILVLKSGYRAHVTTREAVRVEAGAP